ncbi:MAG TPA: hypothetical protein VFV52_00460 [Bacilli bacterium]|nr:hypothetical protein [Bacilli bacterium]
MRKSLLGLVIGTLAVWGGLWLGWWWITFVTGALLAMWSLTAKRAAWAALATGGLGWALPLALHAVHGQLFALADLVGQILGLGSAGLVVVLALPVLLGLIVSGLGAWAGRSLRFLLPMPAARPEPSGWTRKEEAL